MPISACLLTRDEESSIGRAVRSLVPIADQVVVVDTGSTDRTVPIAREVGAEVHSIVWADDFAAGRNAAIEKARFDWILWVNPDETYLGPGRPEVEAILQDPRIFGYFAKILPSDAGSDDRQPGQTWDLRLFRARPGLKYVGRVHPTFDPTLLGPENGLAVEFSTLTFRSGGRSELGPMTEAQARWTLALVEKELADRPGQLRYAIEAARLLRRLGDFRAHAAAVVAAEAAYELRDRDRAPTEKVQHLLEMAFEMPAGQSLGPIDRDQAIRMTLKWFRDSPPLLWVLAGSQYARGEVREAAGVLEHLVELGEAGNHDRSRPFPAEIVGDQARMNLAACYARLGREAEARTLFSALLHHPSYGADAASNLRLLG